MTCLCLGAILADLVRNFKDLQITAIVRNKVHIEAVRKLGVNVTVVEGKFGDAELIAKHARTADITINAAGSDDVPLTEAILAGQKARVVEDKKDRAALLHTSGVAVFAGKERDGSHHPDQKQWNDNKEKDIEAINADMLHGPVDELIMRASKGGGASKEGASQEGYTESYIVCPGAIVGPSSGPIPTVSLFCRFITKLALDHDQAVYVGEGSNVFYAVCLDDLIDLYRLVFARILSREFAKGSPYTRYYIGTSTPLVWKDIATSFGKTLKQMGKIATAEPRSINVTDLSKSDPTVTKLDPTKLDPSKPATKPDPTNELLVYTSASQNVQAERSKALGWKPRPVVLDDWTKVEYVKVAVPAPALQEKK